ncbi:MAG: hypothetical protein GF307_11155 [candidate division Zixibacteria bacterium]|nr:hypothetical protein [candidate division Zixibacteria bacterium]
MKLQKVFYTVLILVTVLINAGYSNSQAESWKTFTDMNYALEFRYNNGLIWGAAPGGVFAIDSTRELVHRITNIEGLKGLELDAIEIDSAGYIWSGSRKGYLTRFDENGDFEFDYLVFEKPNVTIEPKAIYDICADGDWLWVGREEAISKFSISREEIKENIYRMGPLSYQDIAVCYVHNDLIWFGCSEGIGFADKNSQIIPDPEAWTVYSSANPGGLDDFDIRAIVAYRDTIYAGTTEGIYKYDSTASPVWSLTGLEANVVHNLRVFSDTLFAATDSGPYFHTGLSWSQYNPSGYTGGEVVDLISTPTGFWTAYADGGLGNYTGSWQDIFLPGPRGNTFMEIAATEDIAVFLEFGIGREYSGAALSFYDGSSWANYTRSNSGMTADNYRDIAIDSSSNVWIGYWGSGVDYYDRDDSTFENYNRNNSKLRGVGDDNAYIAIDALEVDPNNNLWLGSYAAPAPYGIFVITPDSILEIHVADPGETGLGTSIILDIQIYDELALVGTLEGFDILDFNGNVHDQDNYQWYELESTDGLVSAIINDSGIDNDGIIWIATAGGLNYIDSDLLDAGNLEADSLVLPFGFGPGINAIEIDGLGNKWLGTSNGLLKLAPDNVTWTTYTTQNSQLVDDNILSLEMVNSTGILWIGTGSGISMLDTGLEQPSEDLSDIGTYPNPAVLAQTNEIFFSRIPTGSRVYIYTVAGEKIIDFPAGNSGGLTSWDFRNSSGEMCAGGVYLYHVATSDNEYSHTGKFVFIR